MIRVNVRSNISQGIERLKKEMLIKERIGVTNVLNDIIDDVDNVEPKIPVKTGKLKDSVKTNIDQNNNGTVQWEAPYSVAVHEAVGEIDWSRDGSGPQFVRSKITNQKLREEWGKRLAEDMKL